MKGALFLADGKTFQGELLGAGSEVAEVVFNTGMTGYEESFTDPSYTDQILTLTYPLVGNYGTSFAIRQGERPSVSGVILSELIEDSSNWRSEGNLARFFTEWNIPVLHGADTRALTRAIRELGTPLGILAPLEKEVEARERLQQYTPRHDQIRRVTTPVAYKLGEGRTRITVIDCGIKKAMLEGLAEQGCTLTVVPAMTGAAEILATRPDGVFVSNGPGDPADVPEIAAHLRELLGKVPLFGICMGHQLLATALGAKTFKLKFGHRGANHPVLHVASSKVTMSAQNHGYAVEESTLPAGVEITERSLHDGTVEGFRQRDLRVRGIQYHPEAAPGPSDNVYLFAEWLEEVRGGQA